MEKKDPGTEKKDPGTEKMYPGAKKRIRVLTKKDPSSGVNLALADINNFHTKLSKFQENLLATHSV